MPIPAGIHLGPYEILAPIGAGGMGEVYRARDTRLNRDVAVKVLPSSFTGDADRRARFEREAQAIAALSHPNILAIFDTGAHQAAAGSGPAVMYVVTELLEGETLRERLQSTHHLPVRKSIDIAIQVARGLAAAHSKGLVHRDLKPENIFLLSDGQVKILDFGLARQADTGASGATETVAAVTDPGTVLGTVGYMAPEQVRGQAIDARTDLFALGAVLYEMLAGRRAFARETSAETMTAILREDPAEMAGSRAEISPALDRIVRHCLEKNAAERFQTARDVAFALEGLSGSSSASIAAIATPPPARLRAGPWVTAAGIAVALVAGLAAGRLFAPITSSPRFELKTFDRQLIFSARFMPDGQTIAYSAAREGTTPELFILHPDSAAPHQVAGPGTLLLAVSSKGELAVLTGASNISHRLFAGTLARLTPGGSPRPWLDNVREADWSPDGTSLAIIRMSDPTKDTLEYPAGTVLREMSGYLSDVRVSHDGRRVAFVEHHYRFDDRGAVKVIDTDKRVLASTGDYWGVEGLAWSADDTQVVFAASEWSTSGGVMYQPYMLSASGGTPAQLALPTIAEVFVQDVNSAGQWLLTRDEGRTTMIVKKPGESVEHDISWLDFPSSQTLSPDGSLLVFTDENGNAGPSYGVMIQKMDGSLPVRLGDGSARQFGLSPDGQWVAASVLTTNQLTFYSTGTGVTRRLDIRPDRFDFAGWFPDSLHVLVCGSASAAPRRCYRQATTGGPLEPVGPDTALGGSVAPDGAMVMAETDDAVWRYPASGGARVRIAAPKGNFAGWSSATAAFFARTEANGTVHIDRVDWGRATTPVATIVMPDRVGLTNIRVAAVVGDNGRFGYVYDVNREFSALVVVSRTPRR